MQDKLSREISRILHGKYIEESEENQDRERRERNQEKIEEYWDEISKNRTQAFHSMSERLNGLYKFYRNELENNPCAGCPNNPRNGGSGVCLCTLGTPTIT